MNVIDDSGDLTVKVVEYQETREEDDGERQVQNTTEFRVSRRVLSESSKVWKTLLTSNFLESAQTAITLEEDRQSAMEIWFRVLHAVSRTNTYTVPIAEMWHLVAAADKYDLDIKKLKDWFGEWYEKQQVASLNERQLLYPCWRFDHAKGFSHATRFLAYSTFGHISEENPTKLRNLHLPSRIIQQLNAAKGRLRTILHTELFKPNEQFLGAKCKCKEKALFFYEKTLMDRGVWPLEKTVRTTSMGAILKSLHGLTFPPQENVCMRCSSPYLDTCAKEAYRCTAQYFDGLCLDCMDKSRPRSGDEDKDYWQHNNKDEDEWITGCRVQHRQPTWYYSFMGRQERRDHFRKQRFSREHDEWV